jgi:hypothetical protein
MLVEASAVLGNVSDAQSVDVTRGRMALQRQTERGRYDDSKNDRAGRWRNR